MLFKPSAGAAYGLTAMCACWFAHQFSQLVDLSKNLVFLAAGLLVLLLHLCVLPSVTNFRVKGQKRLVPGFLLLAAVFAVFFAQAQIRAHWALAERIGADDEGRDIELIGLVEDLPGFSEHGVRFGLRVEQCLSADTGCVKDALYRLGWYFSRDPQARTLIGSVRPGRRLKLQVRLKRVHSLANPGLFDAELRALEDGVAARGYVRSASSVEPADMSRMQAAFHPMILVNRFRFELRESMVRALHSSSEISRAVMVALVVGDQSAIGAQAWEMFNRTGIGHLISISGLHITMLAGLAHKITTLIWHSMRLHQVTGMVLPKILPTPIAARVFAILIAFGYSALAGWGIPAQRTCWMLAFALLATLGNRGGSALNIVSAALLAVLLIDPWAVLAAGFWLSFAAVAAIVWFGSNPVSASTATTTATATATTTWSLVLAKLSEKARRKIVPALMNATRAQWAVTIALVPLGALFFSSVSLISPLANSIAIPVVSLIVTPLALAGALLVLALPALGALCLSLAAASFDEVFQVMQWLDRFEYSVWVLPNPDPFALALSAAGIFVLLARIVPGRSWGLIALLPILTKPALLPAGDEVWVTALDVGQGMAVLVETANGRLLYDAGPGYGLDNDAGQRVVAPYLRARGITSLQAMAISHKDSDHSGGAVSILRSLKVERLVTSISSNDALLEHAMAHNVPIESCNRGSGWRWGEVRFDWLHPGPDARSVGKSSSNSKSCVLKISSTAGSVLLTGDIEAAQERELIATLPEGSLRSDILLAPHHGSQTSSSAAFLDAVSASRVIFQVGYRNRYRHPNPKVWRRYSDTSAELLRTDWHGAIQIRLRAGFPIKVSRHRIDSPRYWTICVDSDQCSLQVHPRYRSGSGEAGPSG